MLTQIWCVLVKGGNGLGKVVIYEYVNKKVNVVILPIKHDKFP